MRRRWTVALVAVTASVLAGCTAGGPTTPSRPAIFDRAQVPADVLPAEVLGTEDPSTSRYVGEDSAGDRYWAVWGPADTACIVQLPATKPGNYFSFCGGLGISGSDASGVVMEFASAPRRLDPSSSELIGDTLLVQRP
ncbi:hypothetical protein [Microbacterium testaceum]|jgi:hypothetical protein|uniref:hypothetical protein n=1 Tax=Microbacterium testaceum TaxID=2033 RepID=UPI001D173381|nr:hypothetical protein [Microbacterium testaceum]MCC4247425.1 hypothetical protein [Microbacterium testaceum]